MPILALALFVLCVLALFGTKRATSRVRNR
jgi:hypothetical protein